jgi:hypothetical protein
MGMLTFNRQRWMVFGAIVALVYLLAFIGPGGAIYLPLVGGLLFLTSLMLWFVPGVLFAWTGFFTFHEFGASPTGWQGHLIMLLFYVCLSFLMSWPCGLQLKARRN